MGSANNLRHWIQAITIGRKPQWTLVRIAVIVLTAFLLFKYVLLLRKIESVSMLPIYREGSIHLIYRLAYRSHLPERSDIVAIRTSGETVMYIKRIIARPGETIAIRRGVVYIDDDMLEEPYVRNGRRPWNLPARKLDANQYFVIGDNRSMPQEQHEFGAIEADRIVGRVIW